MKLLIVDDDKECCDELGAFFSSIDHNVKRVYGGIDALYEMEKGNYDAVISDVSMPVVNGIELVEKARELKIESKIILISGQLEIVQSINAIELGIYDFFTKPVDINVLADMLSDIEKEQNNKQKSTQKDSGVRNFNELLKSDRVINIDKIEMDSDYCILNDQFKSIIIFSEKIKAIFKKIRKLYEYPDIPVLIQGETGTGKEIIARTIHYDSTMCNEPFIGLNCSTIPKDMFESELFGYTGGSFTGANPKGASGKIQAAAEGTLFLDEITEIPLDVQVKLLRVLQEKEYYKLGSHKRQEVDCRIVCATNMDIEMLVGQGKFREDLFYRLNVCKVKIPPLREHSESIVPLAINFLKTYNEKYKKNVRLIETGALRLLEDLDWKGNIRELENFIINVIIENDERITEEYLRGLLELNNDEEIEGEDDALNFELPKNSFKLEDLNMSIIKMTLKKFKGNKTKTAKYLGISRNQLYRRFNI